MLDCGRVPEFCRLFFISTCRYEYVLLFHEHVRQINRNLELGHGLLRTELLPS